MQARTWMLQLASILVSTQDGEEYRKKVGLERKFAEEKAIHEMKVTAAAAAAKASEFKDCLSRKSR